jgi:EAL domain-containing protein (putative c-di-GMP-specific phosphodiesterase class I)
MDVGTVQPPRTATPLRAETGWLLSGCLEAGKPISKIPITTESFVIGRRPGLSLTLPSSRVSGRHAEILLVGEHLFIRDLGSTNGTYVNRRRVTRPTPVGEGDHIELADMEFRLEFRQRVTPPTFEMDPSLKKTVQAMDSFEENWILSQFEELMRQRSVTPHFQPIVMLREETPIGYEALARSKVAGLETPSAMFQTAQLVHREVELSQLCRERAVEVGKQLPRGATLFVNTHPTENLEQHVLPSLRALRERCGDLRLVVEIHEGVIDDAEKVRDLRSKLIDLGVDLAYDDFGAGQSRLLELVKAPPNYLKFDSCLVRNAHRATSHQWKLLKMLVDMSHDFATATIAEGVECGAEAEACRDLGFDFAQGFHFGRPAPLSTMSLFSTQFVLATDDTIGPTPK